MILEEMCRREEFVNQAEALKAQLVCISTLMTTTMSGMEDIIELLKERGIRDNVKVMVGEVRYRRNMQMISERMAILLMQ